MSYITYYRDVYSDLDLAVLLPMYINIYIHIYLYMFYVRRIASSMKRVHPDLHEQTHTAAARSPMTTLPQ